MTRETTRRVIHLDEVVHLLRSGVSLPHIADQLGVLPASIGRAYYRGGHGLDQADERVLFGSISRLPRGDRAGPRPQASAQAVDNGRRPDTDTEDTRGHPMTADDDGGA